MDQEENNKEKYSQTCDKQPPKGQGEIGCLTEVAAYRKNHPIKILV